MPRNFLHGILEVHPDERLISSSRDRTIVHKFYEPLLYVFACVVFGAMFPILSWATSQRWSGWPCILSIAASAYVLCHVCRYLIPLKEVWIGDEGLLVTNFEVAFRIPFEAVQRIRQRRVQQCLYIAITLDRATPFGRRFTFISADSRRRVWSVSRRPVPDEIVVELQARVEAAQLARSDRKDKRAAHPPRSVMADDELDGPS